MKWGLSKEGFYRPNQNEIREKLDEKARELFGNDVNVNNKSPIGFILGLLSWFFAMLWEVIENVYKSAFPSQAEGVSLDYLTPFYGTSRRRPQYSQVPLEFTGTPNYTIPFGRIFETENKIQFVLLQDVTLDNNGDGLGDVSSLLTGAFTNVAANTITVQVEPDVDILTVTNGSVAEGGADEEGDEELRKRLSLSNSALGSGTVNAIYADLLEIPGVRAVNVKINETSSTVGGQPPHSIAVFTHGGDVNEIANALMKNYAGLQFFGTTTISVNDVAGNPHDISFSESPLQNTEFEVTVTKNSSFPSDGEIAVKDAIISVIGGTDSTGNVQNGLNMGQPVYYASIISAVMSVPGVVNVQVLMNKKGVTPLNTNDITIASTDVANVLATDIEVTVNA